jgi:hypothetical protein
VDTFIYSKNVLKDNSDKKLLTVPFFSGSALSTAFMRIRLVVKLPVEAVAVTKVVRVVMVRRDVCGIT